MEPITPETPYSGANTILSPEVDTAKEVLKGMKSSLSSLGATFDALSAQTIQIATLGGDLTTAQQLNSLRSQMRNQDKKQLEGISEISLILEEILNKRMMDYLEKEVQKEIEAQIEQLVEEQVKACLKTHIPQELQDEVEKHKNQLEEVRRELHNSESRRANLLLRRTDADNTLNTIYLANGEVSSYFPKTLNDLFELDAVTAKALVVDYEIPDVSESKERNLNRFMQFCGVSYQMVNTGSSTRRVGLEREEVRT